MTILKFPDRPPADDSTILTVGELADILAQIPRDLPAKKVLDGQLFDVRFVSVTTLANHPWIDTHGDENAPFVLIV